MTIKEQLKQLEEKYRELISAETAVKRIQATIDQINQNLINSLTK